MSDQDQDNPIESDLDQALDQGDSEGLDGPENAIDSAADEISAQGVDAAVDGNPGEHPNVDGDRGSEEAIPGIQIVEKIVENHLLPRGGLVRKEVEPGSEEEREQALAMVDQELRVVNCLLHDKEALALNKVINGWHNAYYDMWIRTTRNGMMLASRLSRRRERLKSGKIDPRSA